MTYPICFVSLGPGEPDLITVKRLKQLEQADIIYCPATINKEGATLSRAADIVKARRQGHPPLSPPHEQKPQGRLGCLRQDDHCGERVSVFLAHDYTVARSI